MSKAIFNYKGENTSLLCEEEEKMEDICKRYGNKLQIDINNLQFLYNGSLINLKLKYIEIANNYDKERKIISILVYDINNTLVFNREKKYEFPICTKCQEDAILEISDYKINLYGCKNDHNVNNILISEYDLNQYIDLTKIECNKCQKKQKEIYNNEMYICNGCNIILCPMCRNTHNHNMINYDMRNYICNNHNEMYIGYCKKDKINICIKCQKEHIKHELIYYGEILKDKNELLNKIKILKLEINKFNNDINEMIKKLNNVKYNIQILFNIYNNIIEKYDDKYRNYELLKTFNNFNIIDDIKKINNINNLFDKFEKIIDIYNQMNYKDEIKIIYNNINKEDKIKIFGETFIHNNKSKCKIIYGDKEYNLTENFNAKNMNKLEIKLKGIKNITNMKGMFYKCNLLESLPDIYNWNTSNIRDMSYIFSGCSNLKSLPDLSKWNTNKA